MAAEDDPHFMYILNFNRDYVVRVVFLVISQARCYLKRDPFAYETSADVHLPRNEP